LGLMEQLIQSRVGGQPAHSLPAVGALQVILKSFRRDGLLRQRGAWILGSGASQKEKRQRTEKESHFRSESVTISVTNPNRPKWRSDMASITFPVGEKYITVGGENVKRAAQTA